MIQKFAYALQIKTKKLRYLEDSLRFNIFTENRLVFLLHRKLFHRNSNDIW